MQTETPSSDNWLGLLRQRFKRSFPRLLHSTPEAFARPLLDEDEIHELRSRILARQQQPFAHSRDTASQRMGDNRSSHRGYGMDYEESRSYLPGDDPRYLNWALSARTGELHTKVFREERRPGVFIVIDRRNSMRFGTRTRLKVTQALRVAACIAFAAEQRHASVGGVVLNSDSHKLDWFKESADKQASLALIHAANTPCPPTPTESDTIHRQCHFSEALNNLQAALTAGSQLFLISDFIDLDETLRGQLLHLSAEHSVHAIHISDPAEHKLPNIGQAPFHIDENNQVRLLDTNASKLQNQYAQLADKHFTERQQLFRGLGIHYTTVSTMDDEIESLLDDN